MVRLLFEDLVILIIAEVVAMLVVLAIHRRRMTPRTRRAVWIVLACCIVLIAVNKLVTTDGEQVEKTVAAMARAVDDGDVPAIAGHIDDGFRYRQWDKAGFLAELNIKLQHWRIDEARVGRFDVRIDGDQARASFRASCDWKGDRESQAGVSSSWELEFVRRPDGWKLRRILTAKLGPAYAFDLKDVWNY